MGFIAAYPQSQLGTVLVIGEELTVYHCRCDVPSAILRFVSPLVNLRLLGLEFRFCGILTSLEESNRPY